MSSKKPWFMDPENRLSYLADPELVSIIASSILGKRVEDAEAGVTHPMDPRQTPEQRFGTISQQPPPQDLLGSAMERGNPLAWMEQVQEPEGTPPPGLVETLARKFPQFAEQVAIMAGAAKGVGGARGTPRMQWEPRFGAETPRVAPSGSRKPLSEPLDTDFTSTSIIPRSSSEQSTTSARKPKAILIPASMEGKIVDYTWETPGGKALSKPFTTEAEALANRPEGFEHLDMGYQPFKADIASVTTRATPPKLEMVSGSGLPEEVVLRFEATDQPLSLAEVNSMFPNATIQRMGSDMVFDSQGSQKFRLRFNTPEEAAKARAAFGENVSIRDLGKSDKPVIPEPKQIEANPELVSALAAKGGNISDEAAARIIAERNKPEPGFVENPTPEEVAANWDVNVNRTIAEADAAASGQRLPKSVSSAVSGLPPVAEGFTRVWRVEGPSAVEAGGAGGKSGGEWFETNLGAYATENTSPENVRYVDIPTARFRQLQSDPNATEVQLPEGYIAQSKPLGRRR